MYVASATNRDWNNNTYNDTAQTRARAAPSSNGIRPTGDSNSLIPGLSAAINNSPTSSSTTVNVSNQRDPQEPQVAEPSLVRLRHDNPTALNPPKLRRDPKPSTKAPNSEGTSTRYVSQWGAMINMIRAAEIPYQEFQRSYSEKLNAAIARYPEQSKDWQIWYAEGVLWDAHFTGKKFPGKEPFKLPLVPGPSAAQSEHYATIESLMEAKALKGGFRRQFFQSLNAKRHEANEKRPIIERYKKAFWVDNEIWSQFWPNEPFPVKEPYWAEATVEAVGSRRTQQKPEQSQRSTKPGEMSQLQPQIEPSQLEPTTNPTDMSHSSTNSRVMPASRSSPGTNNLSAIVAQPQPHSIIQGRAPAHILQGLLETQKNLKFRSPTAGTIIMINRSPVFCNDKPQLPREIFLSLQAEDDHRGWEVQVGIGCYIQCTSVSTGDLLLWTLPLANGSAMTEMPGIHFIQGWIQRILTHGLVTISSHWKDLQNQTEIQPPKQELPVPTTEEIMREEYKTTFRASDLDVMVIEETAKVEGNLRLVLDEETGEVITVAELVKRTRDRCTIRILPTGAKRKDDRGYENVKKKICS